MAIHMFACIDTFSDQKMTSDFMAASIGTDPVISPAINPAFSRVYSEFDNKI